MMKEKNINLQIDILINSPHWDELDFDPLTVSKQAISEALAQADLPDLIDSSDEWEVSLALADDNEVQRLNKQFRGVDKSTNVLAFSGLEKADEKFPVTHPDPEMHHMGDIVLCYQTLEREARDLGVSFKHHFMHLVVHGTLHILGYDHNNEDNARIMESLEIDILKRLGVKNPYALDKYVA